MARAFFLGFGLLWLAAHPAFSAESMATQPSPALPAVAPSLPSVRVRDIARVQSVRSNQLVGYGLVVGLNGTGDAQQSTFTFQSIMSMLQRFGVSIDARRLRTRNVAAVMVTADLPAFAKNGSRLDVTVSSLGDATSLVGGVLLQTPLLGANDEVYSVAQGPLTIGGFNAGDQSNSVTKNHPTTGRIPGGALVEQEVRTDLIKTDGCLKINLAQPEFGTAARIADAVCEKLGPGAAIALDAATVQVTPPAAYAQNPVPLIATIQELQVQPTTTARVVINERTGTVIIGGDVRIAPVAVAHGALTVAIQTDYQISQPPPFTDGGQAVVVPQTGVNASEERGAFRLIQGGATLAELVRALNSLRVSPRDIISVIQAIKQAGGLYAEVEVQ